MLTFSCIKNFFLCFLLPREWSGNKKKLSCFLLCNIHLKIVIIFIWCTRKREREKIHKSLLLVSMSLINFEFLACMEIIAILLYCGGKIKYKRTLKLEGINLELITWMSIKDWIGRNEDEDSSPSKDWFLNPSILRRLSKQERLLNYSFLHVQKQNHAPRLLLSILTTLHQNFQI